jgi:hypothetical protein
MAPFSSRIISHSVIAAAVAMRRVGRPGNPRRRIHPAPYRDDGFLALLGNNGDRLCALYGDHTFGL